MLPLVLEAHSRHRRLAGSLGSAGRSAAGEIGKRQADQYADRGGTGGQDAAVPDEPEEPAVERRLRLRREAPLNQERGWEREGCADDQSEITGDGDGAEPAILAPLRSPVTAGGLIKPAPLSEPSFRDQENQREHDQQQAQDACGGIVGPSSHLLEHGVGECLVAKQ